MMHPKTPKDLSSPSNAQVTSEKEPSISLDPQNETDLEAIERVGSDEENTLIPHIKPLHVTTPNVIDQADKVLEDENDINLPEGLPQPPHIPHVRETRYISPTEDR